MSMTLNSQVDENSISNFLDKHRKEKSSNYTKNWDIDNGVVQEKSTDYKTVVPIFIDMIKENKILNKESNWIDVINRCYNQAMVSLGADGPLFDLAVDSRIELFKQQIKFEKDKGNLVGFGDAKINEAISVFGKFIGPN